MPPKKRTRSGAPPTTTSATHHTAPTASDKTPIDTDAREPFDEDTQKTTELQNSTWTCDQESALFMSLMRWKPAGMHKHFRMIAISEHLRARGYDPDVCLHMRVPSIWQKLRSLYNLDTIDERESIDSDSESDGDDPTSKFHEFQLPETTEYRDAMLQHAYAGSQDPPSSPPALHLSSPSPGPPSPKRRKKTGRPRGRSGVVYDTEEGTDAASSPRPGAGPKTGRGGSSRALGRRPTRRRAAAATAAAAAAAASKENSTEADEEQTHGDGDDGDGHPSDHNPDHNEPSGNIPTQTPRTRAKTGAARGRTRAASKRTGSRGV